MRPLIEVHRSGSRYFYRIQDDRREIVFDLDDALFKRLRLAEDQAVLQKTKRSGPISLSEAC